MSLLNTIRGLFSKGTSSYNDFELAILYAVMKKIPEEKQLPIKKRISQINLVQRLDGGREVNGFQMKMGRSVFAEETKIINSEGEKILAKAKIFTKGTPRELSCKIWMVDGHLFSLEFDEPTEHIEGKDIKTISIEYVEPMLI